MVALLTRMFKVANGVRSATLNHAEAGARALHCASFHVPARGQGASQAGRTFGAGSCLWIDQRRNNRGTTLQPTGPFETCSWPRTHEARHYSSQQSGQNNFQGGVLMIPNPILILKNKLREYQIRKFVDASFSLSDFAVGVAQAVECMTELLSSHDYTGMDEMLSGEVIDSLRDITADWSEEKLANIGIGASDIASNTQLISRVESIDDVYYVDIDTSIIALKGLSDSLLMIIVKSRFQRAYSNQAVSDWSVVKIDELSVRTFQTNER